MSILRSHRVTSLLLLSSALFASCALPSVDVTPRYGLMSIDGDFGASSTNVTSTASLEEAGLDDDEGMPGLRADLKWGLPHLVLSTGAASFSGDGRVDAAIEIGGVTIAQNTPVESDLDLAIHSALLTWDLLPGKTLELGAGLGAALVDFDIEFDDGGGNSVDEDESVPVPLLALNAGLFLFKFEITAIVSGMSIQYDGNEGTYIDADIFGRYKFLGGKNRIRGSFILGWKQTDFDVDYDDGSDEIEVDVSFAGPYLGFEFTL